MRQTDWREDLMDSQYNAVLAGIFGTVTVGFMLTGQWLLAFAPMACVGFVGYRLRNSTRAMVAKLPAVDKTPKP